MRSRGTATAIPLERQAVSSDLAPQRETTRRSEPGWWQPGQPGWFRPADRSRGEWGCRPSSRNQSDQSQPGQTEPAKYASCHSLYGKHGKDHVAGDPPGGYCPALKCRAAWRPQYSRYGPKFFAKRQMAPNRSGTVSPNHLRKMPRLPCAPLRMPPGVRTTGMAGASKQPPARLNLPRPNSPCGLGGGVRLRGLCRAPSVRRWGNAGPVGAENVSRRPTFWE